MVKKLLNLSSNVKDFALRVLDAFDKMARPEIKNIIMQKIWNYVKGYSMNIIMRKPDVEIKLKLQEIHGILDPLFKKVDTAYQLKQSKKLNDDILTENLMKLPDFKDIMELID